MRVGFIINSYYIPAWLYTAIEKTITLEQVIPCLFILEQPLSDYDAKNNKKINYKRLAKKVNNAAFNLFSKWEEIRCKNRDYITQKSDAFSLKDIRELMPFVPIIDMTSKDNGSDYDIEEKMESIRKVNPDVLIALNANNIKESLYTLPSHGIWSYDQREPEYYLMGFWETYQNEGVVTSRLWKLMGEKQGQILARVTAPVDEQLSFTLTRNSLAWDSAPLLYLCLDRLIKTGKPFLNGNNTTHTNIKQSKAPNFLTTIGIVGKYIYRKIKASSSCLPQHWTIHLSSSLEESKKSVLHKTNFNHIKEPRGKFWADPFLFHHDNKDYLFFEEFDYSKERGIIKVAEIEHDKFVNEPITILDEEFHFSYPLVFIDEGTIYLLPEQAESGEIAIYRCLNFPGKWEKAAVILKGGYYVDPTLLKRDGKWWLFFVERMTQFGSPTVYGKLWFSNHLFGPWNEHPLNPISIDCQYSRSGGAILHEDNQTIRVVQDCSRRYGYGIHFLKITHLSETDYSDELIGSIKPNILGVDGVHTINFSDYLTAIDTRTKLKMRWLLKRWAKL